MASPLTADDIYGAPDPGWYNQGSGWSSGSNYGGSSYSGSGYGGADGSYGSGDAYGYGYSGSSYDTGSGADREYDPGRYGRWTGAYDVELSREPQLPPWEQDSGAQGYDDYGRRPAYRNPETEAPAGQFSARDRTANGNGYGAPDWARDRAGQRAQQRRPGYDGAQSYRDSERGPIDGYGTWQRPGYAAPDSQSNGIWRAPPTQPKYRFRDDPALEQHLDARRGSSFSFRPLSQRERDRQQANNSDPRFVEPDRDRHSQQERSRNRGTAFGYAPGRPPEDFFQQYYRSGP